MLGEGRIGQQQLQQATLTTAEVQHPSGATALQHSQYRRQALLVQAHCRFRER